MKTLPVLLAFLALILPSMGQEKENPMLSELSDAEADVIVREKFEAQEKGEAERLRYLTSRANFEAIDRKVMDSDGRKIIMNRVSPPVRITPTEEVRKDNPRQAEETGDKFLSYETKEQKFISLSATVYDRKFTELRWDHKGEQFLAYSSIDFNFMQSFGSFETDDTSYSFFMGIGNESAEVLAERNRLAKEQGWQGYTERRIPQMPEFDPEKVEYAVVSDDPSIVERDEVFGQINALHAYYQANEQRLKTEYQRREALNAARKRYEAANPEKPKDTIINFWPIRGSIHQEPEDR